MNDTLKQILSDGWWSSLGIPALLIIAGVLSKMLIKKRGPKVRDLFLGVEGGLAALTTILTDAFDTGRTLLDQQAELIKLADPKSPIYQALIKSIETTSYRLVGTGFAFGIGTVSRASLHASVP